MSFRAALRGIAAGAADASGALRLAPAARAHRIVMYHRVLPLTAPEFAASHPGMVVGLDAFRMHLDEYRAHFRVVTMEAFLDGLTRPEPGPPLLAITFDDGWKDTVDLAVPELARRGLTATIYAAVKFVEASALGEPFASPRALADVAAAGFEIGGHTWSHRELPDVPGAELEHEVADSRRWLEDTLGCAVTAFAYPRGKFDDRSVALARQHYRSAVTVARGTCSSASDSALLPRIGIHHDAAPTRPRLRWRLANLP